MAGAGGVDEKPNARVPEDVLQLSRAIGRVDVNQDGADGRRGELDDRPFGSVRRPDAHAVAAANPQGKQSPRGALHLGGQLGVRPPDLLMPRNQGQAVRLTLHRAPEALRDGHPQQRRAALPAEVAQAQAVVVRISGHGGFVAFPRMRFLIQRLGENAGGPVEILRGLLAVKLGLTTKVAGILHEA